MKKILITIITTIIIITPLNANATEKYKIVCEPKNTANNTQTCDIMIDEISEDRAISTFVATFELTNAAIKTGSIIAESPWVLESEPTITSLSIKLTSPTKISGKNVKIASITFDTGAGECKVTMKPCDDGTGTYSCQSNFIVSTPKYICKTVGGKYYGKDGSEITSEQYQKDCVNNPQTGSFLPYAVISAGIILAIGVFVVSRKNNKLYRI